MTEHVQTYIFQSLPSWEGNKMVLTTTSDDPKYSGQEHITTRELVQGKLVQVQSNYL